MTGEEFMSAETISDILSVTGVGVLIGLGIALLLGLLLAGYIYLALAWQTIAKKLNYKRAWLAWIPIANLAMMLQLGGFHWAWILLILIPILGWIPLIILLLIATWIVFEKRKYPGWLVLLTIIPQIGAVAYLVVIGFVAWKDMEPTKKLVVKKATQPTKKAKKKSKTARKK